MIDEQKLLHNLKKRNRNSLDDIIKIYTPYISVIVYNTVGCKLSKEDMEEIVSDTFFLLWQNSLNIDETKGNMRSYLATIARNTSKNKLRKYHSNEVLNEQIISSDLTPQDNIIKAENSQFLTELITSLGEPDSEHPAEQRHHAAAQDGRAPALRGGDTGFPDRELQSGPCPSPCGFRHLYAQGTDGDGLAGRVRRGRTAQLRRTGRQDPQPFERQWSGHRKGNAAVTGKAPRIEKNGAKTS